VKGSAEKGASAEALIDQQMLAVFGTIVVGEGAAELSGERLQSADDAAPQFRGTAAREKAKLG